MECTNCGRTAERGDNFCRSCGAGLYPSRLPVVLSGRRVPSPYRPPRPAIWQGVGVLAGAVLVEILRRQVMQPDRWIGSPLGVLARHAGKSVVPAVNARGRSPAKNPSVEISETFLFVERKVKRS